MSRIWVGCEGIITSAKERIKATMSRIWVGCEGVKTSAKESSPKKQGEQCKEWLYV